jgi:hypothetical protein
LWRRKIAEVAAREGIAINQLIDYALAEKMSALITEGYLDARDKQARNGNLLPCLRKIAM